LAKSASWQCCVTTTTRRRSRESQLIERTTPDHPRNWRNPRRGSAVSQQLPDADLANHADRKDHTGHSAQLVKSVSWQSCVTTTTRRRSRESRGSRRPHWTIRAIGEIRVLAVSCNNYQTPISRITRIERTTLDHPRNC
jgi:hypothetical protein